MLRIIYNKINNKKLFAVTSTLTRSIVVCRLIVIIKFWCADNCVSNLFRFNDVNIYIHTILLVLLLILFSKKKFVIILFRKKSDS